MPNSFVNFCYNIAGKREDMEVNQPKQDNSLRSAKAKWKRDSREAARKRAMNIRTHNTGVRMEAMRGVRRPGKDHSGLFQTLDQLLGSVAIKTEVVREVVEEALRFKRRALAQLLEDYIMEMEIGANPDCDQACHRCAILCARSSFDSACKETRKSG